MKRLLPLLLVPLLVACHDTLPLPDSTYSRVVIVYLIGENSLSSNTQSDLNEIRSAYNLIPDGGAMVVYFDNSRTDVKPQILRFDNTMGETLEFEYGVDVISTDSATMLDILKYIVSENEADEYALIIGSHGSGWMPQTSDTRRNTIGIDNGRNTTSNTGTQMEIHTLRGVLEATGVHWRYVMFDACFMQCIEVAYELRNLTDWCITSPAEIPDNGAAYDRLMPYFFEADSYAKDIAEQYYGEYSSSYGMLISSIRSDQLDLLATATARCVTGLADYPTAGIQQYCAYSSVTGWKPEFYDLGSCIYHWTGDSVYATWQSALEAAIPYRYYSPSWLTSYTGTVSPVMRDGDHYAGASMYVPEEGRDELNAAWRRYEWYERVGYLFDK